jgi:single-stranded-DNA-specific exonuclease
MRVGLRSEMGGSLQAMAFRAENTTLGAFLAANRGQTVHVAGMLSSNFWNGRRSAQFRIVDAAAVT